jgi:hypothetical protein
MGRAVCSARQFKRRPVLLLQGVIHLDAKITQRAFDPMASWPSALGRETWLETASGKPHSSNSFGNKFKSWCVKAGLPQCDHHGLRKIGAVRAAEAGASEHELLAMFGWDDASMARVYTRKAAQKKLAAIRRHTHLTASHSRLAPGHGSAMHNHISVAGALSVILSSTRTQLICAPYMRRTV